MRLEGKNGSPILTYEDGPPNIRTFFENIHPVLFIYVNKKTLSVYWTNHTEQPRPCLVPYTDLQIRTSLALN